MRKAVGHRIVDGVGRQVDALGCQRRFYPFRRAVAVSQKDKIARPDYTRVNRVYFLCAS